MPIKMKYVENLSKGKQLPNKLHKITCSINEALEKNFDIKNIKSYFDKLIRFGKYFIYKLKTEKDFEEFILAFEQFFKNLDIEKLHNNTARNKIPEFSQLNLFKQFFYIATPLKSKENFEFIKGGICYNWAIFFYNLFSEIDKRSNLEKNLISFNPYFSHGVFLVGFKNKKFIIDPYAKENGLLTELRIGNKVYLGALDGEFIYGIITSLSPLTLKVGEFTFNPKIFSDIKNFIEDIPTTNELINVKTYLDGQPIHLLVKHNDEHIFINYKGQQLYREKDFALTDVVGLYMELEEISQLDILLALLGFDKESLQKGIVKELEILATKIDWDFVFEKLGIKEDIKMFTN